MKKYSIIGFIGLWLGLASYAGASDFDIRCADADVVRCWGFDVQADYASGFAPSAGSAESRCENGVCRKIDTTVKAGGAGSLRFEIPSQSPANSSGNWRSNFSDDFSAQFGENSVFFVQWRQRFSEFMVNHKFKNRKMNAQGKWVNTIGGWKTIIIGAGDTGIEANQKFSSCTSYEIVLNNYGYRGFPFAYWGCGTGRSFQEPYGPYDFKQQNKVYQFHSFRSANQYDYCLYSTLKKEQNAGGWTAGKGKPMPGCVPFYPNEWLTFQVGVHVGNWGDQNSHVDIWMARDGESSVYLHAYDITILSSTNGSGQVGRYGKIYLLPYNTYKDESEIHPSAFTWYDELIVSRSKIPDPSVPANPRPSPLLNVIAR